MKTDPNDDDDTMTTDPNESAFPYLAESPDGSVRTWYEGLSKRELLAAMAMQGLCANPEAWQSVFSHQYATKAVEQADLLIDALNGVGK